MTPSTLSWKAVTLCLLTASTFATADLVLSFTGQTTPALIDGCEDVSATANEQIATVALLCTHEATKDYYDIPEDSLDSFVSLRDFLAAEGMNRQLAGAVLGEQQLKEEEGSKRNLRQTSPVPTPFEEDEQHRRLYNCPQGCQSENPSIRYGCCINMFDCSYCAFNGGTYRRRERRMLAARKMWNESPPDSAEGMVVELENHMIRHLAAIKETCSEAFKVWIDAEEERKQCFGDAEESSVLVIDLESS